MRIPLGLPVALLFLLLSLPVAQAKAPDKLRLKNMAINQQFSQLSAEFDREKIAARRTKDETNYMLALEAMQLHDKRLAKVLSTWVENEPESVNANLAIGVFRLAEGWRARGGKFANKTRQEQFAAMAFELSLAEKYLQKAAQLDPKNGIVALFMMRVKTAQGSDQEQEEAFESLLRANPQSFQAYWFRANQLTPRWGGSYALLQKHIDKSQKLANKNPKFKKLQGVIEKDKATLLWGPKRFRESQELLDQAIRKGGHFTYYSDRAWTHEKLGNKEAAIDDYTKVLSVRPDHIRALRRRGILYKNLKQYSLSLRDLDRSVALEPDNEKNVFARANVYRKAGKQQLAMRDYDKAIELDPSDYWQWKVRARLHRQLNQHEKAYLDGKKALELKPNHVQTWYEHARSLHILAKHQELVEAAEKILEHGNPRSDRKAIAWAKQTIKMAKARGMR